MKRKGEGWHPQDIIAAVKKRGTSLQALARAHGFGRVTLNKACTSRFPRAHNVIAEFLGIPRQAIWPQFYDAEGTLKTYRQVRVEAVRSRRKASAAEARAA